MNTDEMPIPPLDPVWYRDLNSPFDSMREWPNQAAAMHREVIFKMRETDYILRMQCESRRLERERQMEIHLRERTEIIKRLNDQIRDLQSMKIPTVAALREAYAGDKITLEEFDRLVLCCIAAES